MTTIDRTRLHELMERERGLFRERHPRSRELAEDARSSLLFGVPMNWMTRWPGDHPVFVDRAEGARFWDVDGNAFVDFCLGDTGGMAGHAPKVSLDAIAEQAARGITLMLPTEDAAWVGREMARRFGVPYWQFCLTATDANRFAIRWARQITDRSKIIVHNWNYHGSVDETFATLDAAGNVVTREGNLGKPVPLTETTRVVELNDLEGLERALAERDVAVCLFEPALTNIGIVLPDPGYHEAVRELCTKYETLLLIDDNVANLRLIERILETRPGIQILAALQGGLGLELAREHHPDLVLHGHAHSGTLEGRIGEVPVYNVSVPVIGRDFWLIELSVPARAATPIR